MGPGGVKTQSRLKNRNYATQNKYYLKLYPQLTHDAHENRKGSVQVHLLNGRYYQS